MSKKLRSTIRVKVSDGDSAHDHVTILVVRRKITLSKLISQVKSSLGLEGATYKLFDKTGSIIGDPRAIEKDDHIYISKREFLFEHTQSDSLLSHGNDWIEFNVGGQIFATSKTTLRREPQSFLYKLVEGKWNSTKDSNGRILIDRSPELFIPIIHYLRTGNIHIETRMSISAIIEEIKFFNIVSMMEPMEQLLNDSVMDMTRKDIIKALVKSDKRSYLRFQGLNLRGIDLSKLDLSNVNFKYSDLKYANLSGCNLNLSDLEGADLSYANLKNVTMCGCKFNRANFTGADLTGASFESIDGTSTSLVSCKFDDCIIEETQFSRADMRLVSLKRANIEFSCFREVNLAGANLESAILKSCDLFKCNLKGTNFTNVTVDVMSVSSR